MTAEVVLPRTDGVEDIRLDRPEKKNAPTRAKLESVSAALEKAGSHSSLRVVR